MAWQQPAGIFNEVYGFDSDPTFNEMKKNWEQFAITSCAWEYIPTGAQGSTVQYAGNLFVFEDIDTSNTTGYALADIVRFESTKILDPTKHHKGYINLRKISSQMDCPW